MKFYEASNFRLFFPKSGTITVTPQRLQLDEALKTISKYNVETLQWLAAVEARRAHSKDCKPTQVDYEEKF